MNAIWLLGGTLLFYVLGYRLYGRFVGRLFGQDPERTTPAHTKYDKKDFVPAKNWWVLFGHHFSSICGAGPIVGPALACAYWGWLPSVVWILIGSVFMGAVSDFSSLFVSIRSEAKSISEIARDEISPKVRLFFSVFIWISLILVIAVFAIFAAKTFITEPNAVLPSFGLIPVALMIGWMLYRKKFPGVPVTVLGLVCLVLLLFGGTRFPISLDSMGGLSPQTIWILVLLLYCAIASVTPVQILLQPRDYLASFILFAAIGIGSAGVILTHPQMAPETFHGFFSDELSQAGPLWPMMFVTIACGAISGFHSLVSSGTTCKQISSERHACRVGYGGMLVEGFVGVLVIICVSAGLSSMELKAVLKSGGPIAAFSQGFGAISNTFMGDYGTPFAVMALNAFILTTLDTATRIARYLTSELFGIKNQFAATAIVVAAAGLLALTGQWNKLWPAFGASNQLIAGLALLVASCWLLHRGKKVWVTLIPAILMLVTTVCAFLYQIVSALHREVDGVSSPDFFIAAIASILVFISFLIAHDTVQTFRRGRGQAHGFAPTS